jgi:undecaprenyl-diphosphatase
MALIRLRPSATDLAVSRACLRIANPAVEQPLRVLTWLADEKIMVAAAAVFWAATRASPSRPLRREADQMLCSLLVAGVVPHLFNIS